MQRNAMQCRATRSKAKQCRATRSSAKHDGPYGFLGPFPWAFGLLWVRARVLDLSSGSRPSKAKQCKALWVPMGLTFSIENSIAPHQSSSSQVSLYFRARKSLYGFATKSCDAIAVAIYENLIVLIRQISSASIAKV